MSNAQLDGSAVLEVERITREATKNELVKVGSRTFSTKKLYDPETPQPEPAALTFRTLSSLSEYVLGPHDAAYVKDRQHFIHVESPTAARLVTGLFGDFNQRVALAKVEAIVPALAFGNWQDPEAFNIALQANFEPSTERSQVLAMVGGLRAEAVQTTEDDGVTQSATARRGVVSVATVKVPNPVNLRPYRSFAEIAQVESPFVLRLRGGGEGELPECALFEADGGRWRLAAIERIKAWLKAEIKDQCEVYG